MDYELFPLATYIYWEFILCQVVPGYLIHPISQEKDTLEEYQVFAQDEELAIGRAGVATQAVTLQRKILIILL